MNKIRKLMREHCPKQVGFMKDSSLNPHRTSEEEYTHSVNYLVDKGVDISEIYDHEEFVRINRENHLKKYRPVGGKVAPRQEGPFEAIVELGISDFILLGIIVTSILLVMRDFNII